MILEKIIFSVAAFYLFAVMFFKMIKRNDIVYILLLVIQAIGITLNFIEIFFALNFNITMKILIYLLSIVLPSAIIVIELKSKVSFAEKIKVIIARIALKFNNTKLAKKILLETVKKFPKSYEGHKYLAEVYEKEGGMRKSIDEYVKAVDLNKKDYNSYYRISFLLNELGQKDDAKVMLENLLAKKPEYIKATLLLGDILCDKEEYKEALIIYNNGLKYSPNDYDLLYSMGIVYTMLNDFKNAKEYYEKAATINNLLFKAYYDIAQINLISNELDDAERYFTKALDDEELEPDAYYNLGKVAMLRGDYDNAVKFVNLAIQLNKKYVKIAMNEQIFIPVASKFDFPVIEDEELEEKSTLSAKELKLKEHLEKTYKIVDMLSMARTYKPRKDKEKEKNERE